MNGRSNQSRIFWRVTAFAALAACSSAHADTPLSLTATQDLRYDSNILRDNARKYRDAVSSTGVQVGLNKEYGRQTYNASATAVARRYKNTKEYDSEDYSLALGMASGILSNWYAAVNFDASQQQQSPQDQGNIRYNETIDAQSGRLFLQYGMYGRWSTNGTYSASRADYKVLNFYDRSLRSLRWGVRYSPTDLLYFDVGVERAKIENPRYPIYNNKDSVVFGDPISRTDLDLTTRWVVTGFSSLTSRIAWTSERHANDSRRDFNGVTGRLAWGYTPAGKISYNVAIDRDTNNAGGASTSRQGSLLGTPVSVAGFMAQSRVSTGLSVSANWQATSKISINSAFSYRLIKEESRNELLQEEIGGLIGLNPSDRSSLSGSYRSIKLGAKYDLARSTSLGCTLEKYDRSKSLFSREYDGETVNCNVNFTVD